MEDHLLHFHFRAGLIPPERPDLRSGLSFEVTLPNGHALLPAFLIRPKRRGSERDQYLRYPEAEQRHDSYTHGGEYDLAERVHVWGVSSGRPAQSASGVDG